MSEETQVIEQSAETAAVVVAPSLKSPFSNDAWVETPIENKVENTNNGQVATETKTEIKPKEEDVFDEDEYLKTNFGWDNKETGLKELADQREKAKTPTQIEFANEQSKKFFDYLKDGKEEELYSFLSEKKRLDKLTTTEINDSSAADIVKLSIYQKNKDLTADDIDFIFNKKFAIPSKPVMTDDKLEEDYKQEVAVWENKVSEIKRELVIEAKMAKPELEKLKTELVLPNIEKGVDPKIIEAQQKELQVLEEARSRYLQSLESDFKKFNGYEIKYKDGEVEIPISYSVTDEEKIAEANGLKEFDMNSFFNERWFGKDGKANVTQLMDDIYLLKNKDKVFQKLVTDAANKRMAIHLKNQNNIDLKGSATSKGTFVPDGSKTDMDKLAATMFSA